MAQKSFTPQLKNYTFEGIINNDGEIEANFEYTPVLLSNMNTKITCTINKQRKRVEDNNYFYGVICYSLAEYFDADIDDTRDWLLAKFTQREVEINGEKLKCSRSLSALSDYEVSELVVEIQDWIGKNFKLMLMTHTAAQQEENYLKRTM